MLDHETSMVVGGQATTLGSARCTRGPDNGRQRTSNGKREHSMLRKGRVATKPGVTTRRMAAGHDTVPACA
jgi:hypothetical protein